MEKIKLTIDGMAITADRGKTILEAALDNGIYIPHLCHHQDLAPAAVCRVCLVEVEGRGHTISCRTPVEEGLTISTESDHLNKIRRIPVELIFANHDTDCIACTRNNNCQLQRVASYLGLERDSMDRMRMGNIEKPIDTSNPFFDRNPNRCIYCGICIRTCDEIQNINAIDFASRGYKMTVSTFGDNPIADSRCESCGECVVRCPVGALSPKTTMEPSRSVKSVCTYCGVGCGVELGVRGNSVVSVEGDRDNAVNHGSLCVKGRYGFEFINHRERIRKPLIKKNGKFEESTWDEALDLVAKKFREYGKEKVAVFSSAKCSNEDNYVIQKFTRAVLGTNSIDHCARL